VGREFAQCRPYGSDDENGVSDPTVSDPVTQGAVVNMNDEYECEGTDMWSCPGWQDCSASYGKCTDSKCCEKSTDGCFKRPFLAYAQCLPQHRFDCSTPAGRETAVAANWLCPGEWEQCNGAHNDCWNSRCCSSPGFACYEKKRGEAQCLRMGECTMEGHATPPTCRLLTPDTIDPPIERIGMGALEDFLPVTASDLSPGDTIQLAEQHIGVVVTIIVFSVLIGMCCCAGLGWFAVNHLFGEDIREMREQRTMRKKATRLGPDTEMNRVEVDATPGA
jgi:hypothetical protein